MTTAPATLTPLEILDRMRQIVENEMLVRGDYLTPHIENPELAEQGAICGGHKACAVGSLWIAGGVKMQGQPGGRFLPGVPEHARADFLADRPALQAAYAALNTAAVGYAEDQDIRLGDAFDAPLEALFETGHVLSETGHVDWEPPTSSDIHKWMFDVIERAKRLLS